MSAVQPCLDSKEMTTSGADFLESFETIDEERDSDEESFHLFLEDDEDEHIKNDEKLLPNENEDDANKNNDEEKEKVNEPIVDAIEEIVPNCNSEQISSADACQVRKSEEEEVISEKIDENIISSESNNIISSNDNENVSDGSDMPQVVDEPMDLEETTTKADLSQSQSEKCEENLNSTLQSIDNNASLSVVANDSKQMEVETLETSENDKNSTKNLTLTENNDETEDAIPKSNDLVETEDDILNKHVTEVTDDGTDAVDDLDPSLEDTLLNENDEITEKEIPDATPNKSDLKSSIEAEDTQITSESSESELVTTVPESVSELEAKLPESVSVVATKENEDSAVKENSVDLEETEKVSTEKMIVRDRMPQKCDDNSNSSVPSDTEDLLDISMIKDSAQDDADIAEDAFQLEQENEDSDGNSRGKIVERLESIDESSNLENSDEDGKEGYSSENQEISESLQNENEFSDSEKDKDEDEKDDHLDKLIDSLPSKDVEENLENGESLGHESPDEAKEVYDNNNGGKKTAKRTLSDDIPESDAKKFKLVDEIQIKENENEAWDITELESLISFSKFMTKSHLKKLTRTDLEEFCVQKLCEAILHKSELGETNHQLKIQEQTIEVLRKEQTVLMKQIKDLEIVNKKLMHEVKYHVGSKPIVPVKITRSVGLQVRMPQPNEINAAKRRSTQITPQKSPSTPSPVVNNRNTRVNQNIPVTRTLVSKSPQKPGTPILTQVLQNRRTVMKPANTPPQTNTAIRSSPLAKPSPEKRAKTSGSFIDLTDEDDKRTNKKNQNTVKTIVQQGVRVNNTPKTVSSVLPAVVSSSTPQVMYVVQSNSQIKQGLLTTSAGQQKAVLLNFQPTNGVIGSLNTSSVSVIPKVTTGVQLKNQATLLKPKHPAPLPNPPLIQGPNDKSLKGIPPKPVLSIRKTNTGIILQWRMPYDLGLYEGIASYQLYAYQETAAPPSTDMWRKVGDVKAMALPMACTLTQFADKNKYYFAVRPVDIHKRIGRFSNPEEISL